MIAKTHLERQIHINASRRVQENQVDVREDTWVQVNLRTSVAVSVVTKIRIFL